MQWLNLVSEDAGVQSLKAEARRPATTRGVSAVAPYPVVHPVQIGEGSNPRRQKPVQDRRHGERRKGADRRQQQKTVLLDTRTADRLGGTGTVHDWSISGAIREAVAPRPIVLAVADRWGCARPT